MKGRLARSTIQTSAVLFGRLAVQALSILLVARLLGAREYGAFAGAASLAITFGAMSTFGSHFVLMNATSTGSMDRARILAQAIPLTIGAGCALTLAHLLLCRLWLDASTASLLAIACIGVADIVFQPLLWLRSFEVMGAGDAWRSQVIATLAIGVRLIAICTATLVPALQTLDAYAPLHLAATVAGLGLALRFADQPWPGIRSWRAPDAPFIRASSGYAATSITAMAPLEIDKVVAAWMAPLGAAGIYAASTRVLSAAILPVIAMMVAALPRLAAQKDARSALPWVVLSAASAYGLVAALSLWLAAPLVERVFGAAYLGMGTQLRVLALAAPGLALRIASGNTFVAADNPWLKFAFEVVGIVILCSCGWLLAARNGTSGVAWAVVITETTMGVAMALAVAGTSWKTRHSLPTTQNGEPVQ